MTAVPLLASDLDGTLIPLERTPTNDDAVSRLTRLVRDGALALAYVTGRHLSLAMEGIELHDLPEPIAIATDVGTSLYRRVDGRFVEDEAYRHFVESLPSVPQRSRVEHALAGVAGVRLQESDRQSRFKVSFYFDGRFTPELLRSLRGRLAEAGRTRLVESRDPATGVGLLDVLPAEVGKETAVRFLADHASTGPEVLFAGDSGNDRAALLSGCPAILVGNAPETVRSSVRSASRTLGIMDRVYFARRPVAAGVLEGLAHFGVVPPSKNC